jgi:hypothetical protein
MTKPRMLDAIAELVLAAGRFEDGGTLLGASIAAPFAPGAVIRPVELETMRVQAVDQLGEAEAERLFALGADLDVDSALERGRTILLELAEPATKG